MENPKNEKPSPSAPAQEGAILLGMVRQPFTQEECMIRLPCKLVSNMFFAAIVIAGWEVVAEAQEPDRPPSTPQEVTQGVGDMKAPVVRLTFRDRDDNRLYGCSGISVSPHWVMTAAHCVATAVTNNGGDPPLLTIHWGINPDSSLETYDNGFYFYIHPDYDFSTLGDDFALIRLIGSGMLWDGNIPLFMAESSAGYVTNEDGIGLGKISGYGQGTDPDGARECPASGTSGVRRTGEFAVPPNDYRDIPPCTGLQPRRSFVRSISVPKVAKPVPVIQARPCISNTPSLTSTATE